ncbi:hypothetical protein ACQRBK_01920 [Peptoniphilaceae bacterium SGI.137]
MREFNYSLLRQNKWDSKPPELIAAIYKEAGKQEMCLKQKPEEIEKLVQIANIQSIECDWGHYHNKYEHPAAYLEKDDIEKS